MTAQRPKREPEPEEIDGVIIPPDLPDDPKQAYVMAFKRGRSQGDKEGQLACERKWRRLNE